jgi:hypothetical protein
MGDKGCVVVPPRSRRSRVLNSVDNTGSCSVGVEVVSPTFESSEGTCASAAISEPDDVLIVLLASSWCWDARSMRASAKGRGNSRPRFAARRKIPAAALGLKKNLSGTVASSTSPNDEDASPALGHSEVSAVQHSPGEVVKPDVAQRAENDREISSTGGREQAGDVLNDDPSSWAYKLICDPGELEEESGAGTVESCSSACDGEVLAGESSAEEINTAG